jgi:hypothetical protein
MLFINVLDGFFVYRSGNRCKIHQRAINHVVHFLITSSKMHYCGWIPEFLPGNANNRPFRLRKQVSRPISAAKSDAIRAQAQADTAGTLSTPTVKSTDMKNLTLFRVEPLRRTRMANDQGF